MIRQFFVSAALVFSFSGLCCAQANKAPGKPDAPKPAEPRSIPAELVKPAPGEPKEVAKDEPITLRVGDQAPAITIDKWVKGEAVTGFEKGRVYIVEFWATWCGPCKESIPHLTRTQHEYKDRGLVIIGVAASERKPKEGEADKRLVNLEKFVADQGDKMDYRIAYDADRRTATPWMKAAGQKFIPRVFIVDGEGKIAYIGAPDEMDEALAKVVNADKKKNDKPAEKSTEPSKPTEKK